MVVYLYRHYNKEEELLYVGISDDPIRRFYQHEITSEWGIRTVLTTVDELATREEAASAEKAAIRTEKPWYNIVHNKENLPRTYTRQEKLNNWIRRVQVGDGQMTLAELAVYFGKSEEEMLKFVKRNKIRRSKSKRWDGRQVATAILEEISSWQ